MSYSSGRSDSVHEFLNLCVSIYPGTISILKDLEKEKTNKDKSGATTQGVGDISGGGNIVINNRDGEIHIDEKNRNE